MNEDWRRQMEEIDRKSEQFGRYLDRVFEPVTEEDYLESLHFLIYLIMSEATKEYQGWAGVIPFGTEVDLEKVLKKLTPRLLLPVIKLVPAICSKFNVAHPALKDIPAGMKSFRQWHEETCSKLKKREEYPDFILSRIPLEAPDG